MYKLIQKQKYQIKYHKSGAKVQVTGTFLGYNILNFMLFKRGKKIVDISPASIIKVHQIILKHL